MMFTLDDFVTVKQLAETSSDKTVPGGPGGAARLAGSALLGLAGAAPAALGLLVVAPALGDEREGAPGPAGQLALAPLVTFASDIPDGSAPPPSSTAYAQPASVNARASACRSSRSPNA